MPFSALADFGALRGASGVMWEAKNKVWVQEFNIDMWNQRPVVKLKVNQLNQSNWTSDHTCIVADWALQFRMLLVLADDLNSHYDRERLGEGSWFHSHAVEWEANERKGTAGIQNLRSAIVSTQLDSRSTKHPKPRSVKKLVCFVLKTKAQGTVGL